MDGPTLAFKISVAWHSSRISLKLGSATSSETLYRSPFMLESGNDLNVTLFKLEFMAISKLDELNNFEREKEECIDGREIKKKQISNHVVFDT